MRKPALPVVRREPVPPEPGHWLGYARRGAHHVPMRIWIEPPWVAKLIRFMKSEGKKYPDLDWWVVPHLRAEIAGRRIEVWQVWDRVMIARENPQHWRAAAPLIPQEGLSVEEEYQFRLAAMSWAERNVGIKPMKPIAKLAELPLPF